MRRALAAALLGISLWIGSLAWSAYLMTRTVLDPDRSEAVADALLEDEAVRAQLEANIAGSVAAAVPDGSPVGEDDIRAGTSTALSSPAVEAVFRDALVRTHQAFLGTGDAPKTVALPSAPGVQIPLPTDRLPNLGPVREAANDAVPLLASASAAGVALAMVVAKNRRAIVRRAGMWAVGLSALVLVVAFGLPALARVVLPGQAAIVTALVTALAGAARTPAVTLAAVGAAGIVLSLVWRPVSSVPPAPAPVPEPAWRPAPRPRRRDLPVPARRPTAPLASPPPGASALPADRTSVLARSAPDATRIESVPAGSTRAGAHWVDGVGWVHDGAGGIPPGARWVPGVGYVLAGD